jgi:protein-S-isoprenylcysteine O-methyltransferase Ste14
MKPILPPVYFLGSLLLMVILHLFMPLMRIILPPYHYFGMFFIGVGMMLNVWSSNVFSRVKTTIKPFETPSCLVTEGLFRYSRNPMYLGMLWVLLGVFIGLGSLSPVLVVPIFLGMMTQKFILLEEKNLEDTFGEEYLKYKSQVRRWL